MNFIEMSGSVNVGVESLNGLFQLILSFNKSIVFIAQVSGEFDPSLSLSVFSVLNKISKIPLKLILLQRVIISIVRVIEEFFGWLFNQPWLLIQSRLWQLVRIELRDFHFQSIAFELLQILVWVLQMWLQGKDVTLIWLLHRLQQWHHHVHHSF